MGNPIRYERQPVGPARIYATDTGQSTSSEAEELSRALAGAAHLLVQKQTRLDVAQAERAGRSSGLEGNLDPIQSGSAKDLAFAGAQQDAYVQQLHGEVRNMTAELQAKYPDDPEGFQHEFDQRAQVIASRVQPQVRGLVQGEIAMRRGAALADVHAEFTRRQEVLQADVRKTFQGELLQDAQRFARDNNQVALGDTLRKWETFWAGEVAANRMLPAQVDQARRSVHEETMAQGVIADFEDALKAGHAIGYFEHFKKSPPPELSVEKVDQLQRRMEGGINRQLRLARQAERRQAAVVRANGQVLARQTELLKAGVDLGEQGDRLFEEVVSGKVPVPPDKLEDYLVARDGRDVAAAVTRLPLVRAEAEVAALQRRPDASGVDPSQFETKLTPEEEAAFTKWKANYAPNDSGQDYDLRGAFKAGLTPGANGHWADQFKKPNHPTFSDQSIYAKDRPDLAGHWEGNTFVPASGKARSLLEARHRKAAAGALEELRRGLTGPDATGWALQRGVGTPVQMDFSNAASLRASLARMKTSTDEMRETWQQPFSPFTAAQAAVFKNVLERAEPDQALALIGVLADVYGGDADETRAVFGQLDKDRATPLAFAGRMVAEGRLDLARELLVARGVDAKGTAIFDASAVTKKPAAVYAEVAGTALRDPAMQAAHREVTEQLYRVRAIGKGVQGFDPELYAQAADDAAGGFVDVHTGGWWSRVPSRLAAPWPGASADDVQAWLDALSGADLEALGGTAMGLEAGGEAEVARRFHAGAELESAPGGIRVRIGGTLLTDRNGEPFLLRRLPEAGG